MLLEETKISPLLISLSPFQFVIFPPEFSIIGIRGSMSTSLTFVSKIMSIFPSAKRQ